MNAKGRILFVTDTLGYGGAEKQLVFAAEGLTKRGWSVAILNLHQDNSAGDSRPVDEKIQVFVADIHYRNGVQTNYDLIKYTLRIAKLYKPDIIVGFNEIANFCASTTGWLSGIPSIVSERGDPFITYSNLQLPRKIKLWCINRATGGIFQTQQASEFYSSR